MVFRIAKNKCSPAKADPCASGRSARARRHRAAPSSGDDDIMVKLALAAVGMVLLVVIVAVASSASSSRRQSVRYVVPAAGAQATYEGSAYYERPERGLGGKTMRQWCEVSERDNEMVQQRRAAMRRVPDR